MENELFEMISECLSKLPDEATENVDSVSLVEYKQVYNAIIDKLVHNIFYETVGDELLLKAFEKLPRLEKIIVVFHIMLNYSVSDMVVIADTTPISIHTQKYKALQRLRKALGIKKTDESHI